jgi:hypothetical protein
LRRTVSTTAMKSRDLRCRQRKEQTFIQPSASG